MFLEEDGTVVANPAFTGDGKKDAENKAAHAAKCTDTNVASMDMHTPPWT